MMNFAHRGVCVCVKVCLNFLLQTELLLHGSCIRIIQLALILTTVSPLFQLSFHAAEPWQSSNTSSMCKLEECSPNVCLSNSLFSNFPNFAITGHWRQTEKQAQAILSIFYTCVQCCFCSGKILFRTFWSSIMPCYFYIIEILITIYIVI